MEDIGKEAVASVGQLAGSFMVVCNSKWKSGEPSQACDRCWRTWSRHIIVGGAVTIFVTTAIFLVLHARIALDMQRAETMDVANAGKLLVSDKNIVELLINLRNSLVGRLNSPVYEGASDSKQETAEQSSLDAVDQLNAVMPLYFTENVSELDPPGDDYVRVVIITKSAPGNFARRSVTRRSWLSVAHRVSTCQCVPGFACHLHAQLCRHEKLLWFHRFVVGLSNDGSMMERVAMDAYRHMDFLWYPEEDYYRRLTWKVMWAFRWIVQRCARVNFIMTADDDSFVYLPRLASYLSTAPRTGLYTGRVVYEQSKVVRNRGSKWYVRADIFPDRFYPRYVWGAGMLISYDVAELVLERASDSRPWFSVDDAFIGLVLNRSGVSVTNELTIHPEPILHHGCAPTGKQPILVTTIDEDHGFRLANYAMKKKSLCSLLVRPWQWKIYTTVQAHLYLVIFILLLSFGKLLQIAVSKPPARVHRALMRRLRSYAAFPIVTETRKSVQSGLI